MKALIYLVLVSGILVLSSCKNDSKKSFENDGQRLNALLNEFILTNIPFMAHWFLIWVYLN